jgi:replication fork protection complex subunit Csm3/Swi3
MMPVGEAERLRKEGEKGESERPATPTPEDGVPDDDDLYDATPKRSGRTVPVVNDPDEDDLDALIAEAEGADAPKKASEAHEPDGDDLEALMAEAESHNAPKDNPTTTGRMEEDFAAEEAAMQEMDGLW